MAKLPPYFGSGMTKGDKENIKKSIVTIGSGTVNKITDYDFSFNGEIKFKGTFDISVTLTDQDPGAKNGPCSVTLGQSTDSKANYSVAHSKITIDAKLDGKSETIVINRDGKKTDIDASGAEKGKVKLVPAHKK